MTKCETCGGNLTREGKLWNDDFFKEVRKLYGMAYKDLPKDTQVKARANINMPMTVEHTCDEKKTGEETGSSSSAEQFQRSGMEGRKVQIMLDGDAHAFGYTFEGVHKFADFSPIFIMLKNESDKIVYININKIIKLVELD